MHSQRFLEDYEEIVRAEEILDEEPEALQLAPQPTSRHVRSRWRSVEEYQEWRALRHDLEDVLTENDP